MAAASSRFPPLAKVDSKILRSSSRRQSKILSIAAWPKAWHSLPHCLPAWGSTRGRAPPAAHLRAQVGQPLADALVAGGDQDQLVGRPQRDVLAGGVYHPVTCREERQAQLRDWLAVPGPLLLQRTGGRASLPSLPSLPSLSSRTIVCALQGDAVEGGALQQAAQV